MKLLTSSHLYQPKQQQQEQAQLTDLASRQAGHDKLANTSGAKLSGSQTSPSLVTIGCASLSSIDEHADDCIDMSPIEQFFNGRTIFITGSSGFMGKVLLEKLLRCYTGIEHIYLLLRTKRNCSPQERLNNGIFNAPLFNTIRRIDANLLNKVSVIPGDISLPKLGISYEDEQLLIEANVSIIFHSAATVKFDEPLKKSVALNLIAARNMIEFARKLPNLVSLCHVSTAYANSDIKGCDIEERVYPMLDEPKRIIEMAEWMEEDTMQTLKPKLLRNKPNTYTYTKALAELLLLQEAQDLPVCIVRPSIVVATWRDPIRGWVDNLNGPTGLVLAIGKGLLRTLHVKRSAVADIIPADICINLMIAAAWKVAQPAATSSLVAVNLTASLHSGETTTTETPQTTTTETPQTTTTETPQTTTALATTHTQNDHSCEDSDDAITSHNNRNIKLRPLPVYHCTSGKLNPITWGLMEPLFLPIIRQYPSCQVLRYPGGTFKDNQYTDSIYRLFVHYLPALLVDLLCLCTGNKRILMNIYEKIHAAVHQLKVFCTTEWSFNSNNMMTLYKELDPRDQATLHMDIRKVHWESYWHDYILGSRTYVLKEDPKTLKQARKSLNRAYYLDLGVTFLMMLTIWYFLGSPVMNLLGYV